MSDRGNASSSTILKVDGHFDILEINFVNVCLFCKHLLQLNYIEYFRIYLKYLIKKKTVLAKSVLLFSV